MKFNWGTGVVIFLILFLVAIISFVIFAWNQDINLVHRDYYQRGVNYSDQVDMNKRSAKYEQEITVRNLGDSIKITFPSELAANADSLKLMFFRPSDYNLDTHYATGFRDSTLTVSKKQLIEGRYIVKLTWVSAGMHFEVDKSIVVQ